VIQFPETAQSEWKIVAEAAHAEQRLKEKIERDTLVEREVERLRTRHAAGLIFQQELDADTTPALEMTTLATYTNNPGAAPVDMIEGVVKANGLTLFLGPSGSGKSTLALQALYCLMTGEDFLGQTSKPIMGSVGAISYDMDANLMLDWMSGFPNIDATKVHVVNAHKRGNPLGVPAMRAQIAQAWQHAGVEVVVIDSFSASFFGSDQNDAAATQHHYRDLTKFALTECGAKAVIVIVHSTESSPNKPRGSSVHHDVADSILAVWVPNQGNQSRFVDMTKYRAALGQKQMPPCIITAPDAVTHLVDLDLGAMSLEGMHLPTSATAAAFTVMPDTHETPDVDTDDEEDDEV
jgi:archaellum biogenesis ATPase FlaH